MTAHASTARLWIETVRRLRPAQVMHRVRLRAQLVVVRAAPAAATRVLRARASRSGWPAGFAPLDAAFGSAEAGERAARGRFDLVGETRELGEPPDWHPSEASRLWRFNLHYLEWAWDLLAHPDRAWARREFARLWAQWSAGVRFGHADAWAPYVASLRLWTLCSVYAELAEGGPQEESIRSSVGLHAGFVRAHLEQDVGGNHLVKNLKALLGAGVFLDDARLAARAVRRLEAETARQVLSDGGHFERSPGYHCQVLGDLIDVVALLEASGRGVPRRLTDAVAAMRGWLAAIVMPDGDVPLMNDCVPVGRERIERLGAPRPALERLTMLDASGYFVARPSDRVHLVGDVGLPCPPELPAHAHADCLSFELAVDGERVIVDAGTSTYEAGETRQLERSTPAHNTIAIDGCDQTEVWGQFRAARRATPLLEAASEDAGAIEVACSHDGYARLPGSPTHRRRWAIGAGAIEIEDRITGAGVHDVALYLHLAPRTVVETAGGTIDAGPISISFEGPAALRTEILPAGSHPLAWAASGFGQREPAPVVAARGRVTLPATIFTRIAISGSSEPPARTIAGSMVQEGP